MSHEQDLQAGQIGYLQIPGSDPARAARFYERVFGWEIERESSFTSPGLIGNFEQGRTSTVDAGPLLWISVKNIGEAVAKVTANGGRVLEQPAADPHGARILATVADTEGNAIGIFEHRA